MSPRPLNLDHILKDTCSLRTNLRKDISLADLIEDRRKSMNELVRIGADRIRAQ